MTEAATLHRQMLDAVTRRDYEALRRLLSDDYTYMAGDGKELAGPDVGVAVPQAFVAAVPDLTFEVRGAYPCGEDVSVIEVTVRGTHQAELEGIPATGRSIEVPVCNVIEARDGRVVREREYYDAMAIMQQLGVVPEASPA